MSCTHPLISITIMAATHQHPHPYHHPCPAVLRLLQEGEQHTVRRVVTSSPPYDPSQLTPGCEARVLLCCRPGVVLQAGEGRASAKAVLPQQVVACTMAGAVARV